MIAIIALPLSVLFCFDFHFDLISVFLRSPSNGDVAVKDDSAKLSGGTLSRRYFFSKEKNLNDLECFTVSF